MRSRKLDAFPVSPSAANSGVRFPDEGLIKHWEKEIRAFEKAIQQARKRLGQ
jgi:hypothetical protein